MILTIFSGCSTKFILNSEEYKKLDTKHKNAVRSNKDYKKKLTRSNIIINNLNKERDSIKIKFDSLLSVCTLKDSLLQKDTAVIAQNSFKEYPDSKYMGKESLNKKDANQNESFKINLKNLDFYAYRVKNPIDIDFFWKGKQKKLYRNLKTLKQSVQKKGDVLIFGVNAGIFKPNRDPEGLFIKNGKEIIALNEKKSSGNFYLKPNGVFFIQKDGNAQVLQTDTFKVKRDSFDIQCATQSGPMLVIDGKIHPAFNEHSPNRNIRNGVGVDNQGRVVFLITGKPVNLYTFASIFRDHLHCNNALYLDGAISQAYIPLLDQYGLDGNLGPLIGILKK